MKELGESLSSVAERVSGFFDIFDLSFIVSGTASLSAFVVWWKVSERSFPLPLEGWFRVFALLLGCYLSGLVCFAVGRWIRVGNQRSLTGPRFDDAFAKILRAHGLLHKEPFVTYIQRGDSRGIWRLYVRLWAEVRQTPSLHSSLLLLNRYWVLAATYDGVATAALVWALVILGWVLGIGLDPSLNPKAGVPLLLALVLMALSCWREAGRYLEYQIEELVATIAAVQKSK